MALDPSISLQVKPPQFMTPEQAMSLRDLSVRSQMGQIAMADAMRQRDEGIALRQLMSQPGAVDQATGAPTATTVQKAYSISPDVGVKLSNLQQASTLRQMQMRDSLMKLNKEKVQLLHGADEAGVVAYQQAKGRNATEQDAINEATKARNAYVEEQDKNGMLSLAGFGEQDVQRYTANAFDPKTVMPRMLTLKDVIAEKDKNKTPFMKELEAMGLKQGTPEYEAALKKRVARESAPTATQISLTGFGRMSEDALTLAVDQYLAGDTTAGSGYARNAAMKAQFMNRLAERAKERGMSGADVAAKVAEFQGIKAGQRTLGTRQAQIDMAVTEAQNIMPIALETSNKVDRTKYPTINSILLAAKKGTGDESVVRLAQATNALINVYSRAISPTGTPTVSDKDHAREIIDKAYSQGQYAAVVDLMKQEMAAAKESPGQVRADLSKATSGRGKSEYVETRVTASGKKLGKKADGSIEEIK